MRALGFHLFLAMALVGTLMTNAAAISGSPDDGRITDHPVIGSWILDFAPDDPDDRLVMATFHADGKYAEIDSHRVGTWTSTSESTAELLVLERQGPETMTLLAQIHVTAGGRALTASITYEIVSSSPDSGGDEFTFGGGEMVGTRVKALPSGTPMPWATPDSGDCSAVR